MSSPAVRILVADRGDRGARLDRVICRHLASDGVSRTRVQGWIAEGRVVVNGTRAARAAARTAAGDEIALVVPQVPARRVMQAERRSDVIDVLFEDEHLLALNKPAGVVVHPTFGHADGTVMNALLWYARRWPRCNKPALVGRLDKDTSGVLLVSKNTGVHAALQRATAGGAGNKEYLAVVYGRVKPRRGAIDFPLGPDPCDRRRTIAAPGGGGAPSVTRFERIGQTRTPHPGIALLRCTIHSGRRHQIRAHLSACGWPIVGDSVYGAPYSKDVTDARIGDELRLFSRQALHAHRLAFTHPATGRRLDVSAPIPEDMSRLFEVLGLGDAWRS